MITIEDIAKVCHTANMAYCDALGDLSQAPWILAPQWQRDSAVKGVQFHVDNPGASPSTSHDAWLKDKVENGWVYGPVKDATLKQHPCIVSYADLPEEQKAKDKLFIAVVQALEHLLEK